MQVRLSEDSRSPAQRLKRAELYRVAENAGIEFPVGAPKFQMILLLDGAGIDVLDPKYGVNWDTVPAFDQTGNFHHNEYYPRRPPHQSARLGVDSQARLKQELAKQEEARAKEKAQDTEKIEALEREIGMMREILLRIEAREREAPPDIPPEKMIPWQLDYVLRGMGVNPKGMTKEQKIEAINDAKNTAQRGQ